MTKNKVKAIMDTLYAHYPELHCELAFRDAYELLMASRLSAQCTDVRVNKVCEVLFARYPDFAAMAAAQQEDVEEIVRPCGLFHTKARDLIAMSKQVMETGVPTTLDGFLALPGVGRKIANLLMGELYNADGVIVADTHCIRLANRLGFCDTKDPKKVEFALRAAIPPKNSLLFCHALVTHGRRVCKAQNPACTSCFLSHLCERKPL